MVEKVLIANRGEIALRIHRACKELGLKTVAVHSEADRSAMHVRLADESVCIGPPAAAKSYLKIPAILSAAEITGADAVHPGYGFLSENARFAEILGRHNITFIGPEPEHIRVMGDKIAAKKTAAECGIPVLPGSQGAVTDLDAARAVAGQTGYPLLIKAAAGGGGRGMKLAHRPSELELAFRTARTESAAAFGDDSVYIEKFLESPRHVEVQIVADSHRGVIHLGERDCSLQRRHQKIMEEAPCPLLDPAARQQIGERVVSAIEQLGYLGAGTVEFLYQDGEFFFIEMNTRLQVEHPVTEMITGIDLVREQIAVASGEKLSVTQSQVMFVGHALECRINAEHPSSFVASPGRITSYHAPGGLGVRMDSAIYTGYEVPPHYDSLIGKLIVHGLSRDDCLMRMRRALEETVIAGIDTTLDLHRRILRERDFATGNYDVSWLSGFLEQDQ